MASSNPIPPSWFDHIECRGWLWATRAGGVAICLEGRDGSHMSARQDADPQEVQEGLARIREIDFYLPNLEDSDPTVLPSGAVQLELARQQLNRRTA